MIREEKPTFIVITLGDIRECEIEDGCYIHVLNRNYRIPVDDPRIISVKPVPTLNSNAK